MAKKMKPGKRKKPVRPKPLKTKVYQSFSEISSNGGDLSDILSGLEELAVLVDSITEASISEVEDLVIDANSMIEFIRHSVEELEDA